MNILVVTGSLYNNQGGPFLSVRSLINAFLMRGHNLVILGTKDKNDQSLFPDSYAHLLKQYPALLVKALNKFGPYHFHYSPSFSHEINQLKEVDVILIQAVWQWNAWRAFWYGKRKGIKMYISVRGEFNDNVSLKSWKKIIFIHLIKYIFNNIDGIHVLNEKESQVLKFYGIKTPIYTIPNGIFLPEKVPQNIPKKNEVLFLGRLHPMKNIINLIKAWKIIDKNGWVLKIVGGGLKDFEREIQESIGQDLTIELCGPADEIQKEDYFLTAKWFILPSLTEGMPMAVLEAMSFNIPCIISEECNLDEFLEEGAALRVGTSLTEISCALNLALSMNDKDRKTIINKATTLISTKYTWTMVCQKFENVIGLNK